MQVEKIQERMVELADKLNEFRIRFNRYPAHNDFKDKKITPSRAVFHKIFSGMDEAIKYAEGLWTKERFKPKRKKDRAPKRNKQRGFPCPMCGNSVTEDANDFYFALKEIITESLLDLMETGKEQSYVDGVLYSICSIFRINDKLLIKALKEEGFYEAYEKHRKKEMKHADICKYCGHKIKDINLEYPSLKKILIIRFIDLLKSGSIASDNFSDAVMDCIKAVVGNNLYKPENDVVRLALKRRGNL